MPSKTLWGPRLHEYLGGTVRGLDAFAQQIGGVRDHVHLLVGLKAPDRKSHPITATATMQSGLFFPLATSLVVSRGSNRTDTPR